ALASFTLGTLVVVLSSKPLAGPLYSRAAHGGLGWTRPSGSVALVSALVGGAVGGLVVLATWYAPHSPSEALQCLEALANQGLGLQVAWYLMLALVIPVAEEIIFRGFLLGALSPRIGPLPAVGVAALMFVACHLPQVDGYWVAIAAISTVGVLAGLARVRGRSLFAAIILHVSYNAVVVLAMLRTSQA